MLKNVLVTGGFGYVGSRLTPHLLSKGYNVRALDLNLYGDYGLAALQKELGEERARNFEFLRGDIRDPRVVAEAMRGVDAVIHLAAISNDPRNQLSKVVQHETFCASHVQN